jgi:hypothetical protein
MRYLPPLIRAAQILQEGFAGAARKLGVPGRHRATKNPNSSPFPSRSG